MPLGVSMESKAIEPTTTVGIVLGDSLPPAAAALATLKTGDRIVRDQEGFIRVVGRLKDQIIRGGLNIDPAVSELALSHCPSVREVAIVGRPDPRLGERICAVVVLRGSQPPTLADLTAFLEVEGVARSNWPEFLVCVDDLPKTTFGKPDKVRLRELVAGLEGR